MKQVAVAVVVEEEQRLEVAAMLSLVSESPISDGPVSYRLHR